MRIVIAGGTGFLGTALAEQLAADRHDIVVLTRSSPGTRPDARRVQWAPDGSVGPFAREIDGAGAVVNLAGESIATRRWSESHKRRILESRLTATRSLVAAIAGAANPPAVFVSASGIGYYGPLGDEIATESAPPGSDFMARVCVQWEAEAQRAVSAHTRVVVIRSGLVLEKDGGALPRMLPPFTLGVGGRVGSGRQYWPWIHRGDWTGLVRWTIGQAQLHGPVNATAPNPVTNGEFARALGRALHRPASIPAPAFALRMLLGEMADALLLSGQRAIPARALERGFRFRHERLDQALRAIFEP